MDTEITIPFGKYKDKPASVLSDDLGYAEWMLEQDWVGEKYPALFVEVLQIYKDGRQNQGSDALRATENFLLSIDLKDEKIESFDEYPFILPVVRYMKRTMFHPHVTYIVGENGSGKSTLLEGLAITQGFNAEGGTVNFTFSTRKSHSDLHEYLRIAKDNKKPETGFFLRAESFFNVATEIENLDEGGGGSKIINSYGKKSLHEQSHGESFFSLIKNRFGSNGLYILDEPEAALSPQRQMSMLTLMHDLVKRGSQFIISTHSPILLAYPNAKIYEIGKKGLEEVSYEETETFNVSLDFLNNYKSRVETLLS